MGLLRDDGQRAAAPLHFVGPGSKCVREGLLPVEGAERSLRLSSFYPDRPVSGQTEGREGHDGHGGTFLAGGLVVASSPGATGGGPTPDRHLAPSFVFADRKGTLAEVGSDRLQAIRQGLPENFFSSADFRLLNFCYKQGGKGKGTAAIYDAYWRSWIETCRACYVHPLDDEGPGFFKVASHLLHQEGWSYDRINTLASAVASVFDVRRPHSLPFAQNTWVQRARKASKMLMGPRKSKLPDQYFSLSKILRTIASWGSSGQLSDELLRLKTIWLLRVDLLCRAGDLTCVARARIRFAENGAVIPMWWTKEKKSPGWVRISIEHTHTVRSLCSVCCLKTFLARAPKLSSVIPSLTVAAEDGGVGEIEEQALFTRLKPDSSGCYTALTAQSISKLLKSSFSAQFDISGKWVAHDIRGLTSSKLFNLGFSWDRIGERARWSSFYTFKSHYWKKRAYKRKPRNVTALSLEEGLRYDTDEDSAPVEAVSSSDSMILITPKGASASIPMRGIRSFFRRG